MTKVKPAGINADRLESLVNRIEKLIEERKALGGDIRDIFSEAKGIGYDVPTMRKVIALRAMDQADRDEMESMIDLYMHALSAPKRAAVEAMQKGAGREAARAAGIAVGAASQLRSSVHGIENGERDVHETQIGEQGEEGCGGIRTRSDVVPPEGLEAAPIAPQPEHHSTDAESTTIGEVGIPTSGNTAALDPPVQFTPTCAVGAIAAHLPCASIWQEVTLTREEHIAERELERAAATERRRVERLAQATEAARLSLLTGDDMPDFPPGFDRRVQVPA